MSEISPFILKATYVYNPTNEWYQCVVSYEEQQFPIKCLPPRSCRNFPPTFLTPVIKSFAKIPPGGMSKMKSSSSIEKINEYVLSLNLVSKFEGSIILLKEPIPISANISIHGESLIGWFQLNSILHFIKGVINSKTHDTRLSIFSAYDACYKNLTGKITINQGTVNIMASLGKLIISLTASEETALKPGEDAFLCGEYMGFQEDDSQDLYLTIHATTDGLVHADVVDGRKNKFSLLGCRNPNENSIFFLTETDCNIHFIGTISGTANDLSICGIWKEREKSGSFSFFKSQN